MYEMLMGSGMAQVKRFVTSVYLLICGIKFDEAIDSNSSAYRPSR